MTFLSLLLGLSTAQAVPVQLAQQGRLLDSAGAAVNGANTLTFRLFDSQFGGNVIWEDNQQVVFTEGYYTALLGNNLSNPLDDGILATHPVFLEIEINGGGPVGMRHEVVSAPYARLSGSAVNLSGGTVDASQVSVGGQLVIDSNGSWVGPAMPVNWSGIQGIPSDIADGDDDTLAGISCNAGEILGWNGSAWACAADNGLTEAEVESYVTNDAIDLHANTTVGGLPILTEGDGDTLSGLSCQNGEVAKYDMVLGQWACDIDQDTQLTEGDVEGFVTNGALNLANGTTVNGQDIVTSNGCQAGELLVHDGSGWACGTDTDTTLTPTEVQNMIEVMNLNLQTLPQVNGVDMLTADSAINPAQVAVGGSVAGQVLTSDGSAASWQDVTSSGCEVVETIVGSPVRFRLQCGQANFMVEGSTLMSSGLAVQQPWTEKFHCASDVTGGVKCWGNQDYSIGADAPSTGVYTAIATGSNHACAIDSSGAIDCWGQDNVGQVSDSPSGQFSHIVSGQVFSCAIDTGDSITCWGDNDADGWPSGSFTALTAGMNHACALNTSGGVQCWGYDGYNQVSHTPSGNYTQIVSGRYHNCALSTSGTIDCWGYNGANQISDTPNGSYASLFSSRDTTCALDNFGQISCWGSNNYNVVTDVPAGTHTEIATGNYSFCALSTNGTIDCWGDGGHISGAPTTGNWLSISANETSYCGILDSGNVVCWGSSSSSQTSPP